jgi:hypothetical protein
MNFFMFKITTLEVSLWHFREYIITQIGLSPRFLFFLPYSPSHGVFNSFLYMKIGNINLFLSYSFTDNVMGKSLNLLFTLGYIACFYYTSVDIE